VTGRLTRLRFVGALALCLALSLGGQALADSLVNANGGETAAAMGRAASSYLTGIKVFVASALWNRIDPIFHDYYGEVALEDQRYMLSTIAAVQALDPTLTDSYYVGSWILIGNDRLAQGMAMAARGVEINPKAGIVLVNYAQLLSLYGEDPGLAVEIAERALAADVLWKDRTEQANAYAALGGVFRAAGRDDLDAFVQAEIAYLQSVPDDAAGSPAHDHDNDGVPDH